MKVRTRALPVFKGPDLSPLLQEREVADNASSAATR